MMKPTFIVLLCTGLQVLLFLFCGWRIWSKCLDDQKIIFIKRWSENLSLEILNKISLPILFLPFSLFLPVKINLLFLNNINEINFTRLTLSILSVDFLLYWRHRFYHHFMMRWHATHHNDSGYDMSLTLRFHPFENLINYLFIFLIFLFLKISVWEAVIILQILAVQSILSHTSNSNDREASFCLLDRVFITPKIHHLHHTNEFKKANFGFLFSIWDQLFGTFIITNQNTVKEVL